MTSVRRLYVLLCGYEFVPKPISTRGRGDRFILSLPICAYLLDTAQGWILLDTGVDTERLRDPARLQRHFTDCGMMAPVVRESHDLARQFAEIGIGYSDVKHVIISHLHLDHTGHLRHFAHAPIHLQQAEHAHGFSAAAGWAYFKDDYTDPKLDWRLKDGDWEACPGLTLLHTRGHTEGHQSAVVELSCAGTIVLPFDAGDLQENFDDEVPPGECCDETAALASIRRLKQIARERQGQMILLHDPVAIQRIRLAPAWYE